MTIVDLASDTWKFDLDEPSEISLAYVAQWYRVHIGDLNNLINQGYTINSSYEIIDENSTAIDNDAASIFKKTFEVSYYKKQSKLFLGANGVDSISEISQDGIRIRGTQKNDIAKSYNELYKQAREELKTLLNNYKYNRALPSQIKGDDYISKYDVVDPE